MQNVVDLFGEPLAAPEGPICVDSATENSRLGRAAEFYVCMVLCQMGYWAHHMDADGYDVAAETDRGLVRIQVKARSHRTPQNNGYIFKTRRRNGNGNRERPLDARDCDVIAVVAADIQKVMFVPVGKSNGNLYVQQGELLTPNIERISWTECLDSL
jgi:hypothetical protein